MYRDGFCTVSRTDSILRSRAACVMPCMLADGMPGARPRLDDWFHVAVMSQPPALACGDRDRPATQQVANGREPSVARTPDSGTYRADRGQAARRCGINHLASEHGRERDQDDREDEPGDRRQPDCDERDGIGVVLRRAPTVADRLVERLHRLTADDRDPAAREPGALEQDERQR